MTVMQHSTPTVQQFVAAVEQLRAAFPDHTMALAVGVASRLAALLERSDRLPEQFRRGWPDHLRQRVMQAAPDGSWSAVAVVWQPERGPAITLAWCAVGRGPGEAREALEHLSSTVAF